MPDMSKAFFSQSTQKTTPLVLGSAERKQKAILEREKGKVD